MILHEFYMFMSIIMKVQQSNESTTKVGYYNTNTFVILILTARLNKH